jgi:hypothetical protein
MSDAREGQTVLRFHFFGRYNGAAMAGLAALILMAGLVAMAIPARAAASVSTASPHRVSVARATKPHRLRPRPRGTKPQIITGPLINHGGPVQAAPRVYVDFWHWTSDPSGEAPYLRRFLSSVGGTSWLATVHQYGGGWNGQLLAGTWSDPNLVPSSPSDAQIQAEAVLAAKHFGVGNSVDVQIVMATPSGHSTPGFGTSFCAYHGAVAADPSITYTDLPYMTNAGGSCGEDSVNGSNGTLDGVSIVEGHELAESITDPLINAWKDASGNEIGDKCAWTDLTNLSTVAGTFAVQPLWSNAINGCAQSSPVPSPASPLTGVLVGGEALAKVGGLSTDWTNENSGISQIALATDPTRGPLIGVLTTAGDAYVKEGGLSSPWVHEYNGVKQIALATDPVNGPLIAVLTTSGEVFAKVGGLATPWVHEYNGVSQVAVASDPVHGLLIGVVTSGGVALVKEGPLSAQWVNEASGVKEIALASDFTQGPLISVLNTSGELYSKTGGLSTSWTAEYSGVSQIAAASDPNYGTLGGVVTTGGEALAQEGGLAAPWVDEYSGVSQIALASDLSSGPLIEVLTTGGVALAKVGGLSASWTDEHGGASQVATAG